LGQRPAMMSGRAPLDFTDLATTRAGVPMISPRYRAPLRLGNVRAGIQPARGLSSPRCPHKPRDVRTIVPYHSLIVNHDCAHCVGELLQGALLLSKVSVPIVGAGDTGDGVTNDALGDVRPYARARHQGASSPP
jgi:hypothetical protein